MKQFMRKAVHSEVMTRQISKKIRVISQRDAFGTSNPSHLPKGCLRHVQSVSSPKGMCQRHPYGTLGTQFYPECPDTDTYPITKAMMAFCTWSLFSASSKTIELAESTTSLVTSSSRCAGRQCMKR